MSIASIEHVNVTVSNPEKTARLLCELFDWEVRWQGPSQMGGRTVHIGTRNAYLALYTPERELNRASGSVARCGGLNHVGILVEDLDAAEKRVVEAGLQPHNHADYEPGRRFYFHDSDGIEYEVVSYAT